MRSFFVLIIVTLAIILRFSALSSIPPVFGSKEVTRALATQTHQFTDSTTRSSGIGPLSIVATEFFSFPFGLSILATRLPSAIFSILSILILYFIAQEGSHYLFRTQSERNKRLSSLWFPIVVMGSMALSPWHIAISRIDSGINLGLFFLLVSVFLFLKSSKYRRLFIPAGIVSMLSVYADYSFFIPAITLLSGACILSVHFYKASVGKTLLKFIGCIILIAPIMSNCIAFISHQDSIITQSRIETEQMSQARIAYSGNSRVVKFLYNSPVVTARLYLAQVFKYADPRNLFFLWKDAQTIIPDTSGLFYPYEILFLIVGVLGISGSFLFLLSILWCVVVIFPVAVTSGSPEIVRTVMVFPLAILISAYGGWVCFIRWKKNPFVLLAGGLLLSYSIFRFFYGYFTLFPTLTTDPILEYSKTFSYIGKNLLGNARFVVTDDTYAKDLPLYWQFFTKKEPRGASLLSNVLFTPHPPEKYDTNTVYVGNCHAIATNSAILYISTGGKKIDQVCVFTVPL